MNIRKIVDVLLSMPKTIYFNLRYMSLKNAIKLPVFVYWKTRIVRIKRGGIVLGKCSPGIVRIGFPHLSFPGMPAVLKIDGSVYFEGKATMGIGCQLNVTGTLNVGDNLMCNSDTKIDAKSDSSFGRNVLIGCNCYFSDDDGHKVFVDGRRVNEKKGYHIGNNVWLARGATVLKGASIPNDCVVGAGAIVTGQFNTTHSLLAGIPAKIVKENISWEK